MNKSVSRLANARVALVAALAGAGATFGPLALADGPDFSSLTESVILTGVTTAILAVAALKAVPAIASYGARVILGFIKR
ncbi:hypothetical protein EV699_110133 [Plasticicumulans lactativorans]|uniref:Uncharacterized protein n=1 Tax=Plasticicumulans lactativorans TaxID=1133106 RepID=A0A4R2L738_9GAMM|nr:hypothetical protein [Plasticicumulans lactativorans]TCO81107.1 hypothetical protein EV699_110133 [Plasticicumulans lactativorans]